MEMIYVSILEIFAYLLGGKSTDPCEFNFFYISPLNSLNLVLITGAKLDDHRGERIGPNGCVTCKLPEIC